MIVYTNVCERLAKQRIEEKRKIAQRHDGKIDDVSVLSEIGKYNWNLVNFGEFSAELKESVTAEWIQFTCWTE